ncbi:MAG: hypothetical protein ACREVL_06560 [Solimonas sp.]
MNFRRLQHGFAFWLAMMAIIARGMLPGGVMLAHDGTGHGLTVALCSGGQTQIHSLADAATATQAGGECVFAAAALPALPTSLPLSFEPHGAFALADAGAAMAAPEQPGRIRPPVRGPPLFS